MFNDMRCKRQGSSHPVHVPVAKLLLISIFLVSWVQITTSCQRGNLYQQPCLTGMQATNSIGKTACVEYYVGEPSLSKGIVILNGYESHNDDFQAIIAADSLDKFDDPIHQYQLRIIRVTGLIIEYDGHPSIIVKNPTDITVVR